MKETENLKVCQYLHTAFCFPLTLFVSLCMWSVKGFYVKHEGDFYQDIQHREQSLDETTCS